MSRHFQQYLIHILMHIESQAEKYAGTEEEWQKKEPDRPETNGGPAIAMEKESKSFKKLNRAGKRPETQW